ncbi:MAG: lytic transglycosylase domain-containing protein [Paracoccaceae bacterium]
MSVTGLIPVSLLAQDPAPFPEFTFRRLKVPAAGAKNLIDVQIDPSQQIATPAPKPADPPSTPEPSPDASAWFWEELSPDLNQASAGRLEAAVNHLNNVGAQNGVVGPRLQVMQELAQMFGTDILTATVGTSVSPALVLAVIGVESGGNIDALSTAGAQGLMQLIPATAERFGVSDANNAQENILGGVAYLDWLMKEFDGDPLLVLAAYNAGENAIKTRGKVPDFPETRAYVPKVLAAWSVARGLCITPPQFVSDGCVFAVQEAQN